MYTQPTLRKTILLPQAIALYIGSVMGSGILLLPGLAAEIAGPSSLLAWGVMIMLSFPLALVMGWLAALHPNSGGVAHYVTKAFGEKLGTLTGWFFLMSVIIGAPVTALTGAGYLSSALGLGGKGQIEIAIVMIILALVVNYFGMSVSGQIQVIITGGIILILGFTIFSSFVHIEPTNLAPAVPISLWDVGKSAALIFWCFTGWEAVTNLSEEFVDPKRDTLKAVTIAAIIIGVLYFLTAFSTVGTGSYLNGAQDALVTVIKQSFGNYGSAITGGLGFFICMASITAYFGSSIRSAYALARDEKAPSFMKSFSTRYCTPVGGIYFLAGGCAITMALYATGLIPLSTLIQLPNATYILTYILGCGAAIRIFRDYKTARLFSWISLLLSLAILPFVGWSLFYPVTITLFVSIFIWKKDLFSKGLAHSN
ncbi:amino acid efflux transporter [Croceifilum oryzae]|uniref:Amino acid efflux transporter n=1 Tax=Croceifilum oryzae TaxID=1553429 RepID=A0AAJ1WSZ2_9BACL|nr:amino acid permease [Croceifilum oryzae]MDQ0417493.1 amino acid efflux transporter [Croceifilum oryzae]